jgi:hypothetical protein
MGTHVVRARHRRALAGVITALVLASCGSESAAPDAIESPADSSVTSSPSTSTTTPVAPSPSTSADSASTAQSTTSPLSVPTRPDRLDIDLVGCDQVSTNTGVAPAAAAPFVPTSEDLYLDEAGLARVALITKHCDDFVVDGDSLGPGHMDTLWVRIVGPDEVRTRPDTPELDVAPTDYFVPQFIQTDNSAFVDAAAAFGLPVTFADELVADPTGTAERSGRAVNTTFDPRLTYMWTATDTTPIQGPGVVVHVLQTIDDEGAPLRLDIECPYGDVDLAASMTVKFDSGGPFEPLLGTGWTGRAAELPLDCDLIIERR